MLHTEISGLGQLPSPIFNASGARCTTQEELVSLARSQAGAIVSKSCTLEPRAGNPEPRYWARYHPEEGSLITTNSTGLANKGYRFYDLSLNSGLQTAIKSAGSSCRPQPYIISVSGLSESDNVQIVKDLCSLTGNGKACDGIELNLSCPNIAGRPQTGYDLGASRELLRKLLWCTEWGCEDMIGHVTKDTPVLGLKLPVYLDSAQLGQMADLVKEFPVSWITCINSPGNGLIIDPETERPVIKPRQGLGGIGGSVIKSLALGNVYQFAQEFGGVGGNRGTCDVIGCGGVMNGTDVFEHILVGANAVQVGSLLVETGPEIFESLNRELREIMTRKGYADIESFRGRLKPM